MEDDDKEIAETSLCLIRPHGQCIKAYYLPSRGSIKVTRKTDKTTTEVHIINHTKRLKSALGRDDEVARGRLQSAFDEAVSKIFKFLEE